MDRIIAVMENLAGYGVNIEVATPEQLFTFRQHFEKKLLGRTTDLLLQVMQELAQAIGGKTQRELTATLAKRRKSDAQVRQEMVELVKEFQKA